MGSANWELGHAKKQYFLLFRFLCFFLGLRQHMLCYESRFRERVGCQGWLLFLVYLLPVECCLSSPTVGWWHAPSRPRPISSYIYLFRDFESQQDFQQHSVAGSGMLWMLPKADETKHLLLPAQAARGGTLPLVVSEPSARALQCALPSFSLGSQENPRPSVGRQKALRPVLMGDCPKGQWKWEEMRGKTQAGKWQWVRTLDALVCVTTL